MSALLKFILISVLIFSSTAENPVEELRSLKNSQSTAKANPESREKRAIKEHYSDLHCLKQFETSYQTIIRTVESQQNGAVFLNVTTLTSYELCLATCCQTKLCNVAVFDEEGGSCFTFDCGPPIPGEFLCRFTGNEMFTSGALEINRHEFEDSVADSRKGHANELANLLDDYTASLDSSLSENQLQAQRPRIPEQPSVQTPTKGSVVSCGIWQFTCGSGDCIAGYDVCDGIPQCDDNSDESPENCPTTTPRPKTTLKKPKIVVQQTKVPTIPAERPADINKYGREGEKMNPNLPPQQQQQSSNFQHRGNTGLQLPYPNGDPRNNFGYPPQPYNGYPPPNQYGYGYNQPAPNYPPYYNYPQQQQQQQYPNPQQQYPIQQVVPQNPIQNQGTSQRQNVISQNTQTTKIPRVNKGQSTNTKKGELAPQESDPDRDVMNFLVKDLKDEDFLMETPVAAYFTLIMGSIIGFCVCFLVCCRVRTQKRRGRKRNLASDAGDGDYLVNGLYL